MHLTQVVGLILLEKIAASTRRWNTSPREPDVLRLNLKTNSSR